MADEKKDAKAPAKAPSRGVVSNFFTFSEKYWLEELIVFILFILLLVQGLGHFFTGSMTWSIDFIMGHFSADSFIRRFLADPSTETFNRLLETSEFGQTLSRWFLAFKLAMAIISGLLIWFIIWLYRAIKGLDQIMSDRISPKPTGYTAKEDPALAKWMRIKGHAESENPNDWRLAILEADIVLDDILEKKGYFGDSVGDKLKAVAPGEFKTIDNAWEAHKIRNAIAHQGENFSLSAREARRVISLYESFFREAKYI